MLSRFGLLTAASLWLGQPFVFAQSVVSVHSGVIHFFEGSVSMDGHALEPKFGKFYTMQPGSELRTDDGRAELLLTPGVFLRVDQNSSIRMVSNRLSDTCVEFIGGSAALDSTKAAPGAPVTFTYRNYRVRFSKPGRFRLDSATARLRVEDGEAEVSFRDRSVAVNSSEVLPFAPTLAKFVDDKNVNDGLDDWNHQRNASITASNASATASDDLSNALNNPQTDPYDTGGYGALGYPALSPGPYAGTAISPWGLGSPFSPYMVPRFGYGLGYGYIPLVPRALGYRPLSPIRPGTYSPALTWHPIGRTSSSPGYRAPAGSHPVVHGGHR